MAGPVLTRPLSEQEDRDLLRIVRGEGSQNTIRVRRAVMVRASADGARAGEIARVLAADPDTVRDVIHAFNDNRFAALDPHWGSGRPRRITSDDEDTWCGWPPPGRPPSGGPSRIGACGSFPTTWATTRSGSLPFSGNGCGSCCTSTGSPFQRTRTWKESTDPDAEAKLNRIDEVLDTWLDRCFAFDQFGPLSIRPCHGTCWARRRHPDRLPATYHRTHGIRYFHGCYDVSRDQLWGVTRLHKGGKYTLAALKTIRAARSDTEPIYVIMDNLAANKTPAVRAWAAAAHIELCLTPTNSSWADPIECQFGPLRSFVIGNSNQPNHLVLARALQAYLRWRNAHKRDPDVLAAQRRERARVRSEHHQRWGRPRPRDPK